ncbi:hypothetical protein GY45DRAFT_46796 [Cubamyces sp. BRFM 1775]|nr:hypothetical protein GY45DRAFT_46796 [Cubamyces sp. BRFM 1775]
MACTHSPTHDSALHPYPAGMRKWTHKTSAVSSGAASCSTRPSHHYRWPHACTPRTVLPLMPPPLRLRGHALQYSRAVCTRWWPLATGTNRYHHLAQRAQHKRAIPRLKEPRLAQHNPLLGPGSAPADHLRSEPIQQHQGVLSRTSPEQAVRTFQPRCSCVSSSTSQSRCCNFKAA